MRSSTVVGGQVGASPGPLGGLASAVDALASVELGELDDRTLRDELLGLVTVAHRVHVELARRVEVFDQRGGAVADGFRTARAWLQAVGRLSGRMAHRLVRTGRLLTRLPKLAAAAQGGQLGADHLQAVGRLAEQVGLARVTPVEATLADAAQVLDPARFAVVCDRVRAHVDPDGDDPARAYQRRGLTLSPLGPMLSVRGQLDAEGGAALQTALDALTPPPCDRDDRSPAQRRADALVELARRQLTAGTLPTVGGQRPQVGVLLHPQALSPRTLATLAEAQAAATAWQPRDGLADSPSDDDPPTAPSAVPPGVPPPAASSGVLTPAPLEAGSAAPGAGPPAVGLPAVSASSGAVPPEPPAWARPGWADPPWLTWHGAVSPVVAQRIACDADIWRVLINPATGQPLDVGRAHRLVPHWIRRALYVRDRGCRWPGCPTRAEWTDAHHLRPWAEGGETSADGCVLLCRHHHVLVHEGGWALTLDAHTGQVNVTRPDGTPYHARSAPWTGPTTCAT